MSAFWEMGGYGAYVWPCYGMTLLVLGAAVLLSLRAHAQALAALRRLEDKAG